MADADLDSWARTYDVNVLGTVRVTKALLPALRASGAGDVRVRQLDRRRWSRYEGGASYTAAKHGVHTLAETLRLELNGEPVRVIEIAPGMVRTEEFSLNRLGSAEAADAVYRGVREPLVAEDIADCIAWTVTRPHHVNIDLLVVRPLAQAAQHKVAAATTRLGRAPRSARGLEGDAELLAGTAATIRSAKASSSVAVAPGSVVSARLWRDDVPTWPSRVPRPKPACCTSQAALSLTCPSPAGQLGQPSTARSAGTIGLVKNDAGAAAVGVGRVEHHALAAAQPDAPPRARRPAAPARRSRRPACGPARRSRPGGTARSASQLERDVEDDEAAGLALEPAVAVGEAALGRASASRSLFSARS